MQKSLMRIETLSLHFIWCFSSHWSTWQLSVHLSVYKLGLLFDFIMSNFCQNESFAFLLILFNKLHISSHQNKKALSPFYHKKYFWLKMNVRNKGVLHSFSIKSIFYDKMDLRLFYFDVAIYWNVTSPDILGKLLI